MKGLLLRFIFFIAYLIVNFLPTIIQAETFFENFSFQEMENRSIDLFFSPENLELFFTEENSLFYKKSKALLFDNYYLETSREKKKIPFIPKSYLLPENSLIKKNLDLIFSSQNALANAESFRDAGFYSWHRGSRKVIVSGHPLLGNYLVKVYFDDCKQIDNELPYWLGRVQGSQLYNKAMEKLPYFVCPKKWIYKLPNSEDPNQKRKYILIVEDMNLEPYDVNIKFWKSCMTKEILNDLFMIINELKLHDSAPANVALTKDGYLAFVDTKFYLTKMRLGVPRQFFSEKRKKYWDKLCKKGLPIGWRSKVLENKKKEIN